MAGNVFDSDHAGGAFDLGIFYVTGHVNKSGTFPVWVPTKHIFIRLCSPIFLK